MEKETFFFDVAQANNIACDYLCTPGKDKQFAIVSQVIDFAGTSWLKRDTPYVFTTRLLKGQFLDVLSNIGLEPKECQVSQTSVFTRTITVRF